MRFLSRSMAFLALAVVLAHGDEVPYAGTPYGGTPRTLPGTIQAEEYDVAPGAANDVAFHYDGQPKAGPCRTTPDSIGLARFGAGHVSTDGKAEDPAQAYVGWTQTGEWLRYTVNVARAGTYVVGAKLAAGDTGAKVSFRFGPAISTGPVEIPTTAGFQPGVEVYHVWETLDHLGEVTFPAPGPYVLTVKIESGAGLNLDWFRFTPKP